MKTTKWGENVFTIRLFFTWQNSYESAPLFEGNKEKSIGDNLHQTTNTGVVQIQSVCRGQSKCSWNFAFWH